MSEQKIPIPAMLYNSAVGGHVTNSQQIIDENLNREQQDINEEVAAVPYNATTPNGMGRIVLKKTDNFKQVVEAQTNGNTIFVIKYDFTLTGNVTIPDNCILQFEGGHILCGNYTISGNILNSFLDVSNFTTTTDITKALNVIMSLTNAFVPRGIWTISEDVAVPGEKMLFGINRHGTTIRLNGHSIICGNGGWYCKVKGITLCNTIGTSYAIVVKKARYLVLEDIEIGSLYSYNPTNNQCGGILLKNDTITQEGESKTVMTLSRFSNIYIHDVQIGIKIDTTTNTEGSTYDYVTGCHFENITVDVFYDSAIVLWGSRIYENSFDNITVRDNCDASVDRKGITFYGAGNNRITNLKTWADAKGGTHNFYALYIHPSASANNYIDGQIEGLISGDGLWENTFSKNHYDIFATLVDSVTGITSYAGKLCNYNIGLVNTKIANIFNFNNFLKETITLTNCTRNTQDTRYYSVNTTTVGSEVRIEFTIPKIIPANFKIFIKVNVLDSNNQQIDGSYSYRIIKAGITFRGPFTGYLNVISKNDTFNESFEFGSYSIRVDIPGTLMASKVIIEKCWIIVFPDADVAKIPYVFDDNEQLLSSIQIESLLPNS